MTEGERRLREDRKEESRRLRDGWPQTCGGGRLCWQAGRRAWEGRAADAKFLKTELHENFGSETPPSPAVCNTVRR